jgi:hypothetical protein
MTRVSTTTVGVVAPGELSALLSFEAMFYPQEVIGQPEIERWADAGVRAFLAAYGTR